MTPDDLTQLLGDLDHTDRLADRVARIIRATRIIRTPPERRVLLAILDEIGGYRTVEQQDAVRAARESL